MTSKLRTVVHLVALLIPFLAEATSKSIILAILIAVTITYILSEELRLRGKQLPLITKFTLRMSRENETPRLVTAPIYLAVGVIMSLFLFPKNIAYASIAIVAVGDPMAAYFGRRFGRIHIGKKTLEGFAAGVIVSFTIALMWVPPYLALAGSVAGMLLELLGILDDNLTSPIGAGIVMSIASIL